MRILLAVPLTALILIACSKETLPMRTVPDLASVRANLAFTCAHEADRLPALDPEADELFKYARYLQTRSGPKDFDEVARYYRIAAAHGHYKANSNRQLLVSRGLASSPHPSKESIDLASQLIDAGVPSGYYDIGYYLNLGYGLKQDKEMALRYFRKAADLGNAEAQLYVGNLLAPIAKAPEIAKQMRQCATEQGHGKAASKLGIDLKIDGFFSEAVKAFQTGVAAGNSMSASFLQHGFEGPPPEEQLHYLALANDPERSRRYAMIKKFLKQNDGRNPKVPDIDQIVPLPPAKLPPWDETFQWEKERDANQPTKPSDELINRLSQAKQLDPATGLPLEMATEAAEAEKVEDAANVAQSARLPLGTQAASGKPCLQRGLWCVRGGVGVPGSVRFFERGDTLPLLATSDPRAFGWMDDLLGTRRISVAVMWELVSYEDKV